MYYEIDHIRYYIEVLSTSEKFSFHGDFALADRRVNSERASTKQFNRLTMLFTPL
jgi:hypothetical protein